MHNEISYADLMAAASRRRELAKKLKKQGLKPAEIARQLGVTRQRVEQMVNSK